MSDGALNAAPPAPMDRLRAWMFSGTEQLGYPFDSKNGLSHRHIEVLSMSSRR